MAKRLMIQYRFWLDILNPSQHALAYRLDEMKLNKTRLFHKTIRDALRLLFDLQAGKVDVLFELFPDLQDHWKSQAEKDLQERLARLESRLLDAPHQTPPPARRTSEPFTLPSTGVIVDAAADKITGDEMGSNMVGTFGGYFKDLINQ